MDIITKNADIQVNKTVDTNPAYAGQTITYAIDIFNVGPSDAENVVMEETVPLGLGNLEMSVDNGASWQTFMNPANIVNLASGERLTVLIRGTVEPTDQLYITTVTSVRSSTPDFNARNNTSTARVTINKFK